MLDLAMQRRLDLGRRRRRGKHVIQFGQDRLALLPEPFDIAPLLDLAGDRVDIGAARQPLEVALDLLDEAGRLLVPACAPLPAGPAAVASGLPPVDPSNRNTAV